MSHSPPVNHDAPLIFCGLPLELIDHIVDETRGDTAALLACSLTHSSMRARAQFHIFHTIRLTPQRWTEYEELARESPHLGCAVRRLRITQSVPLLLKLNGQDPCGFAHFIKPQAKQMEPLFPAVTKLELIRLDHTALSMALLRNVCNPDIVEAIRMHICVVPTMAYIAEFICSFPRLKKLIISDLFARDIYVANHSRKMGIEGPVPMTFRPSIETLRFPSGCTLGELNSISLTKWLFDQSLHIRLTTLDIIIVRREDAVTLSVVLQQLGPRLQHLYLGVEQISNDATFSDPLTLSHNHGLRTLGLWDLKLHGGEGRSRPSLAWVPRLLRELSSSALEHVHLRLRAGGASPSDLGTLHWAAVDDILCERRFSKLRRVTVEVIRGQGIKDLLLPYIEEHMSGLHARHILCVSQGEV